VLTPLATAAFCGGRLLVSRASVVLAGTGALADERVREQLKKFLAGFCEFVVASRREK
jgi:hypothetical protein